MYSVKSIKGVEFVRIPAPPGNWYRLIEEPTLVGQVKPFWLARTLLTKKQAEALGVGKNSEWKSGREHFPITRVAQLDFFPQSPLNFRLPTEFEWEWASLGGENFEFSGSTDPDSVGVLKDDKYTRKTKITEVCNKKPNGFGLYDMTGNVWEWTSSKWDPGKKSKSPHRVRRGGCWGSAPALARVAIRNWNAPDDRLDVLGVRLVYTGE